jgi:hypothetical protein
MKVGGDKTKTPTPNKQHNIPPIPADAIFEGGSVDEYATLVSARPGPRTSTRATELTYSVELSPIFYRH